jgi:hypothetical protein
LKRKLKEIGGCSTAKLAHKPIMGNIQIHKEKFANDKKSPELFSRASVFNF